MDQRQKLELEKIMAELDQARQIIISSTKKKVAKFEEQKYLIQVEMVKFDMVLKEKDHEIKLMEHDIDDLRRALHNLQTRLSSIPNIMIEDGKCRK